MAVESKAEATWQGDLMSGSGSVKPASGSFPELALTWKQRAEVREGGTSPEELIAAAEAGCFSMALSHGLAQAGHKAERLTTSVSVGFQAGEGITGIQVRVRGRVPGLDDAGFKKAAEDAGHNCPVSKALGGTTITVDAALE
jgi:osmotically inducible protein OsmC